MDSESVATGSSSKAPICQNVIDLSVENEMDEMTEEENAREVMDAVCSTKVPIRRESGLAISQM